MRNQLRTASSALLLLPLLALIGCGGDRAEGPAAQAPPPAAQTNAGAETPVAPMTSRGPMESAPAGNSIQWDLPQGWQSQPPSSPMRMAQATIPGPGGTAELTVFHFGVGGGGGTQANIDRWVGQVEAAGPPEQGTMEVGDYHVTWVDVKGTLKAGGMGMGPSAAQPDSRLLGAVVEGNGGPWFFKITGPQQTLDGQRDAFFTMLKSIRPA